MCNSSGGVLQLPARYRGKDSKIIVRAILHSYVPISCREVLNNVGIATSPHRTFRSFHSIMHCRAGDERLAQLRNCHATTVTCSCDENTGAQVIHRTGDRFCNSYVFQVLLYEGKRVSILAIPASLQFLLLISTLYYQYWNTDCKPAGLSAITGAGIHRAV